MDVLNARCESPKYERLTLAVVLFLVARMGHLNPRHLMVLYLLSTVQISFDITAPESTGGHAETPLLADAQLVPEMKRKLDMTKERPEKEVKATTLIINCFTYLARTLTLPQKTQINTFDHLVRGIRAHYHQAGRAARVAIRLLPADCC